MTLIRTALTLAFLLAIATGDTCAADKNTAEAKSAKDSTNLLKNGSFENLNARGSAADTAAQESSPLALSTTMTCGTPRRPSASAGTQWLLL